jgi:hypothetical protein
LTSLAIVDEAPEAQYLYPESLLYQRLLDGHGIQVTICDPQALIRKDGRLWHENMPVDFVYNRLTDFALERPGHTALKQSYLAREVVVSPNPHAHALYADKRNLTLLCDEAFLREAGLPEHAATTLLAMVPRTETMTADNRDALWTRRRQLFFKPAAGYGSKATYRGDKLTKRVWEEMAKTTYVAQALVPPSERHVAKSQPASSLKADVRNYAYAGLVKLVCPLVSGPNYELPHLWRRFRTSIYGDSVVSHCQALVQCRFSIDFVLCAQGGPRQGCEFRVCNRQVLSRSRSPTCARI